MMRLYHRRRYGRWDHDRRWRGRRGMPARWAVYTLMVLAGIVVLASLLH
jgi:uncharacterized membrane protein YecN with MAPEG domain